MQYLCLHYWSGKYFAHGRWVVHAGRRSNVCEKDRRKTGQHLLLFFNGRIHQEIHECATASKRPMGCQDRLGTRLGTGSLFARQHTSSAIAAQRGEEVLIIRRRLLKPIYL